MTFRRSGGIYFIKSNENAVVKGPDFMVLSFFPCWWEFSLGPIYIIGTLYKNLLGGTDITQEVLQHLPDDVKQEGVAA